ncbi:MAG: hypothetical protein GY822_06980 [Deltaproteobacteria bacterium]|nr:hypothetical protein [Deltaproteobacteria bacterium]
MVRISGGGLSRNPFGNVSAKGTQTTKQTDSVGQQMQNSLFGKKKPPILDEDDAQISALMGRLQAYRKRLARLAGDEENDYDLVLSAGTIAMIDQNGLIYVGKEFLLGKADDLDTQVGVLAHEIGHRPKRWNEYKQENVLTKDEQEKICRTEETRADYFAGKALAELGLDPAPLCRFLQDIQTHPHPEYFSAELRVECVLEGYDDGKRRSSNVSKFFPEFSRMTGAKGDLGIG